MKRLLIFTSLLFLLSVSAQEPEGGVNIHENVGTWTGDNDQRISESEIIAPPRDSTDLSWKESGPYTWFEDSNSFKCESKPDCQETVNNESDKREVPR